MSYDYDVVIVGAGPNGLSAGIVLAAAGCSVLILEEQDTIGGGARSKELTRPGFIHDVCSAIHPLGVGSPFFQSLPLSRYGLGWVYSPLALAHPLDSGDAALISQSIEETAERLGRDKATYKRLIGPLSEHYHHVLREFLGPLRFPHHPLTMAQFGIPALFPAKLLAETFFKEPKTRAAFAGMAAHSMMPLTHVATASFGLMLAMLAHSVGWPMAKGGSQHIIDALAAHFYSLGGHIETNSPVRDVKALPSSRLLLLNITPKQILQLMGDQFPTSYQNALAKYRYGPGVFKIDYALSAPIPWKQRECSDAATVHLGATLEEITQSEQEIARGRIPERPYTLVVQQSQFDTSRAPAGMHTAWAYCHAPHGSSRDMTEHIERQIERFAPGFRDVVLERVSRSAVQMEHYNPNYVGGDINGGVQDLRQLFTRPVARRIPYSTPLPNVYICSSATPPGGGVHGMCGYFAAKTALRYAL